MIVLWWTESHACGPVPTDEVIKACVIGTLIHSFIRLFICSLRKYFRGSYVSPTVPHTGHRAVDKTNI